jgi:hypothetical protein
MPLSCERTGNIAFAGAHDPCEPRAHGRAAMDSGWLTYREAAERLGSTAEVVRYRALRGKWPRMRGNNGRTRVQVPDERLSAAHPVRTPSTRVHEAQLIKALEAHVATSKEQLAAAEARLGAADAQTEKAIAAFAALAERLDALAAARRPWWHRLAG